MTRPFTIELATPADAFAILRCLRSAFEPFRAQYTDGAYSDTVPESGGLDARLATMRVLVARAADGPEIIGTIAVSAIDGEEGHLRGMAVDPQWQGQGVAESLLSTVETALAASKCRRVTLDTTQVLERAIRFYEKHGYKASGKVTDFFGMPLHEYVKDLAAGSNRNSQSA